MEAAQSKLEAELEKYKTVGNEYNNAINKRQTLDGQLHENLSVKQELDLLKPDGEVYKMIGPVLVKQELVEAKQNVSTRIDYINGELKRIDEQIATLEAQQEKHKEKLATLQTEFQKQQALAGTA